jgi:hypothetical protein
MLHAYAYWSEDEQEIIEVPSRYLRSVRLLRCMLAELDLTAATRP